MINKISRRKYVIFAAIFLYGCISLIATKDCQPPKNFSEEMLLGEWLAMYDAGVSSDVLTLNAGRTFTQTHTESTDKFNFTVSGTWWVEETDQGTYIHLHGMRLCNITEDICSLENGGGGEMLFSDDCSDEVRQMKDEVILSVQDASTTRIPMERNLNKDIFLVHLRSDPDRGDSYFLMIDE